MSNGRRYEKRRRKLNMKKVFGVIIAIAVVIMIIISISKLLSQDNQKEQNSSKQYYFTAYKNGKWGVINQVGNEIIPLNHEEMIIIPDKTQDIFIIMTEVDYDTQTYKTIAQNSKGERIFSDYETIEVIDNFDENQNVWFEQGCLKVKKDGKYGLINLKGELLLDCKYENIESLKGISNSLIIEKDGKVGLASNVGDIIIEPKYNKISKLGDEYTDGYIVTNKEEKSGIIGSNKKTILEENYEEIKQISSKNLYVVKQEGLWKIVDEESNIVIEEGYDDYIEIKGDIIISKKGEKIGAINNKNEEKIPFEYQELKYILNKYYIAKKNDKYGVLDSEGNQVLPFEYNYIYNRKDTDFIEAEKEAEKTEVYNKEMKLTFTGILSEVNTEKGYIVLRKDEEWKFYNFKFEEKTEQEIFPNHTLFLSKKDGKYGYKNKEGELIVEHIYDDAKLQNEYGYCSVKKDDKWGSLNKDGNISQETTINLDDYLVVDFIEKWHYGKELNLNYYTY